MVPNLGNVNHLKKKITSDQNAEVDSIESIV